MAGETSVVTRGSTVSVNLLLQPRNPPQLGTGPYQGPFVVQAVLPD